MYVSVIPNQGSFFNNFSHTIQQFLTRMGGGLGVKRPPSLKCLIHTLQ